MRPTGQTQGWSGRESSRGSPWMLEVPRQPLGIQGLTTAGVKQEVCMGPESPWASPRTCFITCNMQSSI